MECFQQNLLREKIEQIGTALFMNLSEAVLKLPSSVISGARMDDYGYIWFFAQKQNEKMNLGDVCFPVRLEFFRKGTDCCISVEGRGWIVQEPEDLEFYQHLSGGHCQPAEGEVMVKVKVMQAAMKDLAFRRREAWWRRTWHQLLDFSSMFFNGRLWPSSFV